MELSCWLSKLFTTLVIREEHRGVLIWQRSSIKSGRNQRQTWVQGKNWACRNYPLPFSARQKFFRHAQFSDIKIRRAEKIFGVPKILMKIFIATNFFRHAKKFFGTPNFFSSMQKKFSARRIFFRRDENFLGMTNFFSARQKFWWNFRHAEKNWARRKIRRGKRIGLIA